MGRGPLQRALLLVGVFVATGLRGAGAAPDDARVFPYARFLPGAEPPGKHAVLVVDGRTGFPVAGAEVRGFPEDVTPLAPPHPSLVIRATTDGRGLALIADDASLAAPFQWVIEARGYAPNAATAALPERAALFPGQRVTGIVREPDGTPWVGGTVELFANCPHGPVLRRGRTDAAGRFVLDDVDPHQREFPQSLRFLGLRGNGGEWQHLGRFAEHGAAGGDFVGRASITVLGVVRSPRYGPVRGAVVRGPRWFERAETDHLGRFRLEGLRRTERLEFFHASWRDGKVPFHVAAGTEVLSPLYVTLPSTDAGQPAGEPALLRVFVTVSGAAGEYPLAGFPVRILSRGTGELREAVTSGDPALRPVGSADFPVAWRAMRVVVGTPFSRFWHQAFRHVEPAYAARVSIVVPDTQARLGLDLWRVPPGSVATLSFEGDERAVPLSGEEPVYLPATGRAFLRVDGPDGWTEVVRLHPLLEGVRTAMVRWPRPREFLLDLGPTASLAEPPRIESVEGVAFDSEVTEAGLVVRTHAQGALRWRMPQGWRAWGEASVRGEAAVEADGRDGHDEAPTVLTPTVLPVRTLSLAYGDGRPATDALVEGARAGTLNLGLLDMRGACESTQLGPGVRVRARAADHVDLEATLQGKGPYALHWGPADLALHVRAGDRAAARFVVGVNGRLYAGRDGELLLKGLAPGDHEMLVGAPGFRTVLVRAPAPGSGSRTVLIGLEPLE